MSRSADKVIPGTKTVVVDYENPESLKKAFTGIEVVLSTAGHAALSVQPALIDAAKAADVQLFVLSEFGMPTDGYTEGLFGVKYNTASKSFLDSLSGLTWTSPEYAKSIGLPTAKIYVSRHIRLDTRLMSNIIERIFHRILETPHRLQCKRESQCHRRR